MKRPWIKLCGSVACLAALLWWTDASAVLRRLQTADMTWITLGVLALTAGTFAMSHRWKVVAGAFDVQISYPVALREYFLAQLINSALPGGVAGDVTRAFRMRHRTDLARAAQSVMAERSLGQIAMFALIYAGFAVALMVPGGLEWGELAWWVLVALTGGACLATAISASQNTTGAFIRTTLALMRRPVMTLHGVLTTFCLVFAFYACARATGIAIPMEGLATLIPLILCAMLIPLSVGGWGWREGAAAALFPLIGAPASAGVAAGITYGLAVLVAALPAAAVLAVSPLVENLSSKGKRDLP